MIDIEIENEKIINKLFGERIKLFTRDVYREVGEVFPETSEIKPIPYRRKDIVPSYNKDVTEQFEIITEHAVLERLSHDIDDVLLIRQINNIRKLAGFIEFIGID